MFHRIFQARLQHVGAVGFLVAERKPSELFLGRDGIRSSSSSNGGVCIVMRALPEWAISREVVVFFFCYVPSACYEIIGTVINRSLRRGIWNVVFRGRCFFSRGLLFSYEGSYGGNVCFRF